MIQAREGRGRRAGSATPLRMGDDANDAAAQAMIAEYDDVPDTVYEEEAESGTGDDTSSATEEPPTLRLTFQEQDFAVFPAQQEDGPVMYLPSGEEDDEEESVVAVSAPELPVPSSTFWEPLDSLFAALRVKEALGEFLEEGTELHLTFPDLDLVIAEDNVYAKEVTLCDISQLALGFQHRASLHVVVSEEPRFITRYNELATILGDGSEDDEEEDEDASVEDPSQDDAQAESAEAEEDASVKDLPQDDAQADDASASEPANVDGTPEQQGPLHEVAHENDAEASSAQVYDTETQAEAYVADIEQPLDAAQTSAADEAASTQEEAPREAVPASDLPQDVVASAEVEPAALEKDTGTRLASHSPARADAGTAVEEKAEETDAPLNKAEEPAGHAQAAPTDASLEEMAYVDDDAALETVSLYGEQDQAAYEDDAVDSVCGKRSTQGGDADLAASDAKRTKVDQ